MRKSYITLISVLLAITFFQTVLTGCGKNKEIKNKEGLDYTVVENADLPDEMRKLIEQKKDKVMRITYTTKDYTYIIIGYGERDTSGYSIKVNDVYLGDGDIYVDTNLLGPTEYEPTNEVKSYPYIVLKLEKREETVIFKI